MDEKSNAINYPDVSSDIPKSGESTCAVCGRELTAYGSKKLKDGMLCRYCKKKLSEWLGDEILAEMNAEDVKAHLAYREKNREALDAFTPLYVAGGKYKLYVDAANDAFLISRKKDFVSANADLLKLSAIKQVRVYSPVEQVQDTETDSSGPAQCFGDVMMDIEMEEGEINHLSFRVNEFPGLETDSEEFNKAKNDSQDMTELLKDSGVDEERIVFEYGE